MALGLSQLIADFHAYFLGLYHQAAAPAASPPGAGPVAGSPANAPPAAASPATVAPFLAFAGLGTPDMFMLKDGELFDGLVVEQFSMFANALPTIDDGRILGAGLLTADGLYSVMLDQSQALSASDMEAFGAIKRHTARADARPGRVPSRLAHAQGLAVPKCRNGVVVAQLRANGDGRCRAAAAEASAGAIPAHRGAAAEAGSAGACAPALDVTGRAR